VPVQEGDQRLYQVLRDEELIVGLLVNIPMLRSPPVLRVSRWSSIDAWL